jgi:outer membrane protein assembly factor BamB
VGWANGLAIREDGTIYLASLQNKLLAVNPDGSVLWEAGLPETPLGAPALGVSGAVFVTDRGGGLTAIDAQGQQLWHYQPTQSGKPAHGAITTEDGSIYYLLDNPQQGDMLIALAEGGTLRWSTATGGKAANSALRLSPDGEELFVKNQAFSTESGELLERTLPTADDPVLGGREQLFTGADRERYMQVGHNVMHWTVQGGDFVLLQTTEWNYEGAGFNLYSSFPTDAGVTSDQKIWLFYSVQYGGTELIWLEPAGEVIGISPMPITKNSILASIDSQGLAYACGLDEVNYDQVQAKCLAYRRGSAEPEWEIGLPGSTAEVGGVALANGRLYAVTKDGYFYAIGEASGAQASATSQESSTEPQVESGSEQTPASAGPAWSTQLPGAIGGMLSQQADGSLLGLTSENLLVQLDEKGQIMSQVMLEPGPYNHPEGRYIIQPIALENGNYLVFSSEQSAYAMDANGTKLWEVKLEANPAGLPEERGDTYYLTDMAGNLYAFGPQGLRWQVKPAGATKAYNSPTIGPDGRLYYVVLIDRKVYVQEVKPDGTPGWQAPVKTGFFTYDLLINGPGTLLFLRDDVFDTQAGVRLDLTPPFRIDEYIMGEDGLNYLRSEHVISQWELAEGGMQVNQTAAWNYQVMGQAPFMSFVTAQKVIWLYYGDTLVWLDLDGNVLGTIPLENGLVQRWDRDNTRYTTCQQAASSDELTCKLYTVDSNGPAWEMTVNGLPNTQWGWITEDGLTAVTDEDVIYHIEVDWPEP